MNDCKRLKDPLYGYIEIPREIMRNIVDTAVFQRLRRIAQTSYSPLYSSAVHNRFVHSLGVYHLGSIASRTLCEEIEAKLGRDSVGITCDLKRLHEIFLLSCLLHDVGHAPFSHTGEKFYLEDGQRYDKLHGLLIEAVQVAAFAEDVPKEQSASAAAHEIMSAIVGITEFSSFFQSPEEREFCFVWYDS